MQWFRSAFLWRSAASVESGLAEPFAAGSAFIGCGGRAHRRAGMKIALGDGQGNGGFDFSGGHLSLEVCADEFGLIIPWLRKASFLFPWPVLEVLSVVSLDNFVLVQRASVHEHAVGFPSAVQMV